MRQRIKTIVIILTISLLGWYAARACGLWVRDLIDDRSQLIDHVAK